MQNALIEYAQRCVLDGLAFGTSGNLSVRVDSRIWVTPTGIPFERLEPRDLVALELDTGAQIDGRRRPSSEVPMHRILYQSRSDIRAIVHTHSPYATVFSCLHRPIEAVHYQIAYFGSQIPVAPYATYGSEALGENAAQTLGQSGRAILLANHGVIAVGSSLGEAFQTARDVEWLAMIYWRTLQIGVPYILPEAEIARVHEAFKTYGQPEAIDDAEPVQSDIEDTQFPHTI